MSDGDCPTCSGFDPLDGRGPVCRCGTGWATRPRKTLTRTTGLAPGKGLSPGKGLTASRGLSRGTGLPRAAEATTRPPLARTAPAPRPRKPRVAPEVRDAVLARAGGLCEVALTEACRARRRRLDSPEGTNQHHRRPGGMGGSKRAAIHSPANLLQVCGQGNTSGCHGWIEKHRTEAYELGLLVHDGQDPAAVAVRLWNGRRVLLGHAGYVDADAAATEPA